MALTVQVAEPLSLVTTPETRTASRIEIFDIVPSRGRSTDIFGLVREARSTQHRSALRWLEGDSRQTAALGALYLGFNSSPPSSALSLLLALPTMFRDVRESLLFEELLFSG